MSNTIIYDAENAEKVTEDNDKTILYDAEEEIKKREEANRVVENAENPDEPYQMDENQQNVFDNGLAGGKFLLEHRCPMCMMTKKTISEMYARKRFNRKKKVIGYVSICANCGFTSFYSTNVNELLQFFKGKVKF